MFVTEKMISVFSIPDPDPTDPRLWYKLKVLLPQLHMETPQIHTLEYANQLKTMIAKDSLCKFCGRDQNDA